MKNRKGKFTYRNILTGEKVYADGTPIKRLGGILKAYTGTSTYNFNQPVLTKSTQTPYGNMQYDLMTAKPVYNYNTNVGTGNTQFNAFSRQKTTPNYNLTGVASSANIGRLPQQPTTPATQATPAAQQQQTGGQGNRQQGAFG